MNSGDCRRSSLVFEISLSRLRRQLLQLDALEQQRHFDYGTGLGMAMLRSLGERFPRRPNMLHVIRGHLRTKRILKKFSDVAQLTRDDG